MFDTLVTEYWGKVLVEEEHGRHGLEENLPVLVQLCGVWFSCVVYPCDCPSVVVLACAVWLWFRFNLFLFFQGL